MADTMINVSLDNKIKSLIFILLIVGALGYGFYWLYGLVNPDLSQITTQQPQSLNLTINPEQRSFITELNDKRDTYLLQATVIPSELGRENPFARGEQLGNGLSADENNKKTKEELPLLR